MRFWSKAGETRLERELRALRPQPRDEFVHRLSRQVAPVRRTRRLVLPRAAFVASLTAAIAASLGVAGALGAAGGSVHAFSISIVHLVSPPKTTVVAQAVTPPVKTTPTGGPTTGSTSSTSSSSVSNPSGQGSDGEGEHHPPFEHEYGHQISICWQGHIIKISSKDLFWYLTHGGRPPGLCLIRITRP